MSKPRFHRYAELPRDPARLLRALRACRDAMQSVERETRIGGARHVAGGHAFTTAIDAVAKLLTAAPPIFISGQAPRPRRNSNTGKDGTQLSTGKSRGRDDDAKEP